MQTMHSVLHKNSYFAAGAFFAFTGADVGADAPFVFTVVVAVTDGVATTGFAVVTTRLVEADDGADATDFPPLDG